MVSRLERWREDARAYRYDKLFREAGVPEDFPQEIKDIRAILVRAMLTVSPEKTLSSINPREKLMEEVAEAINREVGQDVADEVLFRDLDLPKYISPRYKDKSLTGIGFEGIEAVDKRVINVYVSCVRPLARIGRTVGQVRNATLEEIDSWYRISRATSYFAKTAFARPQPTASSSPLA